MEYYQLKAKAELAGRMFEKGAQSRQAEIDATLKQRDSFIKAHHIAMNDVCEHKAKIDELNKTIVLLNAGLRKNKANKHKLLEKNLGLKSDVDELQARVDGAMKYVSESPLKDVSRRAMINFMDILKGNKDEN